MPKSHPRVLNLTSLALLALTAALMPASVQAQSPAPSAAEHQREPQPTTQDLAVSARIHAQGLSGLRSISGYTSYPTVEEACQQIQQWAHDHPNLAKVVDIGDSWEKTNDPAKGYDLLALVLTNRNSTASKTRFLITAELHAREYATTPLVLRFAQQLLEGYGTDPDITWLLDQTEIHIVPMVNPDGRKIAETGVLWRKNTNPTYTSAGSGARGVDLNRNFDFEWGKWGGSSGTPSDDTYRGPSAASEPETQAIEAYVDSLFADQRADDLTTAAPEDTPGLHMDIHSYGQEIYYPWGFTSAWSPNGNALRQLAQRLAYFNGYTPTVAYSLYPVDGAATDYSYGRRGVPVIEIELGKNFFESTDVFESEIVPGNLPALLYAAKVAHAPYQLSFGPEVLNPAATITATALHKAIAVTAVVDSQRLASSATKPKVTAARLSVDVPPWDESAVFVPMGPVDSAWDTARETVTASFTAPGMTLGRHLIYIQGQSANGYWGPPTGCFLNVTTSLNSAADWQLYN